MKFQYFRFRLVQSKQLALPLNDSDIIDRQELLERVFCPENYYPFPDGKKKYAYLKRQVIGNMVHASIGIHQDITLNASPDQEFAERSETNWPFCHVCINLSDEKIDNTESQNSRWRGQIIACEVKQKILVPQKCLRAFAKHVSSMILNEYDLDLVIDPIQSHTMRFWALVKKYDGYITKLDMSFTAPNIIGHEDDIIKDMEKYNARQGSISLESGNGPLKLSPNDKSLDILSRYIDEGNGSYSIKVNNTDGSSKTIKSGDHIEQEDILETDKRQHKNNKLSTQFITHVLNKRNPNDSEKPGEH